MNAQVAQAELNLENTKIKAPSDGFIAKKSVEVGQLAAAGVPLIGFVDAGERWVTANFKETEISDIHPGNRVWVDVDAISGKTFTGKVESLSSATGATFALLPPDNATGNFTKVVQRVPVRIHLENLTPEDVEMLRAGLSADVKVEKK
jgi:membrane fusion protein (multidrug efflux system)